MENVMNQENITVQESISELLNKSSKISRHKNDTFGKPYLTRFEIYNSLDCNKFSIDFALDLLEQDGFISLSKERKSVKGFIYLHKFYSQDPLKQIESVIVQKISSIKQVSTSVKEVSTSILDINFILPVLGIIISTYFTYHSLTGIGSEFIRWSLSFVCSAFSTIVLKSALTSFSKRSVSFIWYSLFFMIALSFNTFHSVKYLYQDYEVNRIKATDPKITELNNLNSMRELLVDSINNNNSAIDGYKKDIESEDTNKVVTSRYWIKTLTANNKNHIQEISDTDIKINELGSVKKESNKSIYQAISELIGVSADLLFISIALIPSLIIDFLCPLFLAIVLNKKR